MTSHIYRVGQEEGEEIEEETKDKKQEARSPAATNYGQHDSIAFPQQRTRTGTASNQLGTSLVT